MRGDRLLDVSVVIFHSDLEVFRRTLESLRLALLRLVDAGRLDRATVWLVDNGSDDPMAVERLAPDAFKTEGGDWIRLTVRRGHGNVGYGAGHDLALARPGGSWHLVLNPDVEMDEDAIVEGLRFLEARPEVGLVTPHAVDDAGRRLFRQALSGCAGVGTARIRP